MARGAIPPCRAGRGRVKSLLSEGLRGRIGPWPRNCAGVTQITPEVRVFLLPVPSAVDLAAAGRRPARGALLCAPVSAAAPCPDGYTGIPGRVRGLPSSCGTLGRCGGLLPLPSWLFFNHLPLMTG